MLFEEWQKMRAREARRFYENEGREKAQTAVCAAEEYKRLMEDRWVTQKLGA